MLIRGGPGLRHISVGWSGVRLKVVVDGEGGPCGVLRVWKGRLLEAMLIEAQD